MCERHSLKHLHCELADKYRELFFQGENGTIEALRFF